MVSTPLELAKSRPAETAMPIATVIAALISKLVGVEDTDTIFYIALLVSFVPAAVTWTVELLRKRSEEQVEPVNVTPLKVDPVSERVAGFVDDLVVEEVKPVEEPVVEEVKPIEESVEAPVVEEVKPIEESVVEEVKPESRPAKPRPRSKRKKS
ncbi:MAG TPA: hypothetical protein VGE97_09210 [Nitrososphaera sp.]